MMIAEKQDHFNRQKSGLCHTHLGGLCPLPPRFALALRRILRADGRGLCPHPLRFALTSRRILRAKGPRMLLGRGDYSARLSCRVRADGPPRQSASGVTVFARVRRTKKDAESASEISLYDSETQGSPGESLKGAAAPFMTIRSSDMRVARNRSPSSLRADCPAYSFSSGSSPKCSSASSSRSFLSGAVSSVSGTCSSTWSPGISSATTFVLAVSPVTEKRTATSARP